MTEEYIRGYIDAIEMAQAIVQFHFYENRDELANIFDDIGAVGEAYREDLYRMLGKKPTE